VCGSPDASPDPNRGSKYFEEAFRYTPPGLKQDLCALKCIFVDDHGSHSWGKWEDPNFQGDRTKAVIAVNHNDLNKKLSAKFNEHLRGKDHGTSHLAENDSKAISLMYTLAHEMGHIKWRKNINRVSNPISAGCPVDTFINYSWATAGNVKDRRWTAFDYAFGTFKNNAVKHLDDTASADEVLAIYNNGLVTGLAANNAEEEFVETYAVRTLMDPFMNDNVIIIGIPDGKGGLTDPIPVNDGRGQQDLQDKLKCVLPLLQPQ